MGRPRSRTIFGVGGLPSGAVAAVLNHHTGVFLISCVTISVLIEGLYLR